MMVNNGYSKISDAHKSRSMGFSSSSVPQTPKPSTTTMTSNNITRPIPDEPEEPKQVVVKNPNKTQHHQQTETELDHDEGGGGDMVLGRSASVSGFQATVKRAFSMRRSSSVSESYCRIHDQYMPIGDQIDDDEDDGIRTRTPMKMNKKKLLRGANIFKACKRLLGLGL